VVTRQLQAERGLVRRPNTGVPQTVLCKKQPTNQPTNQYHSRVLRAAPGAEEFMQSDSARWTFSDILG